MPRRILRLTIATVMGAALIVPVKNWMTKRDIELAYQFVEANEPIAQAIKCTCGCKDSGHTSLVDCFLYSD